MEATRFITVLAFVVATCAAACSSAEEAPAPAQRSPVPGDDTPAGDCAPANVPPAQCAGAHWSGRKALVSTPEDERIASVTPDGLVVAVVVPRPDVADAADVLVATRTSADEPFDVPVAVPGGPYAMTRAALSADGLQLVLVAPSRRSFVELVRGSRAESFVRGSGDAFAALDEHARLYKLEGEVYGDPILTPNGLTLYFARYGTEATKTIYATKREKLGDTWPLATPVEGVGIASALGKRKVPSGVSADERTLFFVDEATGRSASSTRRAEACGFDVPVDLGDRLYASPDATCASLWFTAPGAGGFDVFRESR